MEKNKYRVAYEIIAETLESAEDLLDKAYEEEEAFSPLDAAENPKAYEKAMNKVSQYNREVNDLRHTLKRLNAIANLIEDFEMDYSDDERKALGL